MKTYLYETHSHTAESSGCAGATAVQMVDFYKKMGYDGLFVTDHLISRAGEFLSPEDWRAKIEKQIAGYRKAKEYGDSIGFDVFYGWEYTISPHNGTDLLTYGLDPEWLMEHHEISGLDINEYCDYIHEAGGLISHAHPFRQARYIQFIRLLPAKVDAVEVYNANRTEFENEQALLFAQNYGLLQTSGSDNHHADHQEFLGGMRFDSPIVSARDFVDRLREPQGIELAAFRRASV